MVFEPGLSPACSANPPFRHFFVRADFGRASKRGRKSSKTRKLFLTPLPTVGDIWNVTFWTFFGHFDHFWGHFGSGSAQKIVNWRVGGLRAVNFLISVIVWLFPKNSKKSRFFTFWPRNSRPEKSGWSAILLFEAHAVESHFRIGIQKWG